MTHQQSPRCAIKHKDSNADRAVRRRTCQGLAGGLYIKSGCCMCIMLSNLDSFLPGFSYLTRIDEVEKKKERQKRHGDGDRSNIRGW